MPPDFLDQFDRLVGVTPPEPEPWPDPIPLGSLTGTPPPFPVEALPTWMQRHVRQVADELQAPVDLPGQLAITALSIACAHGRTVHVRNTWHEPLNTALATGLPPSAGKSPAFRQMLGWVETWQSEQIDEHGGRAEIIAQKRRMIEKQMKRAEDKGDHGEAARYLDDLLNVPEVVVPRLIVDDATPEALVDLLARHGGILALVSTEGGPFDLMAGRYSESSNLDVYLKAWSGDSITVDRIGRGSSIVRRPMLTIGLTVQPDVLRALADKPGFRGRGLTARFMYSVPQSLVGWRNLVDVPEIDPDERHAYDVAMTALLGRERSGGVNLPPVEMTATALSTFLSWRQGLEQRRRPEGDMSPLAEWSTKLESTVARTAGLFALADGTAVIDDHIIARAIAVGWYWIDHAKVVHDMWGMDETNHQGRQILAWAEAREMSEFTVRDLYRSLRTDFPTAEDCRPALSLLTERGWLRPMFDGPLVLGRRGAESPGYAIHPLACGQKVPHVNHVNHVPKDVENTLSSSSSEDARKPGHTDMGDMVDNCPSDPPTGQVIQLRPTATPSVDAPHDPDLDIF